MTLICPTPNCGTSFDYDIIVLPGNLGGDGVSNFKGTYNFTVKSEKAQQANENQSFNQLELGNKDHVFVTFDKQSVIEVRGDDINEEQGKYTLRVKPVSGKIMHRFWITCPKGHTNRYMIDVESVDL